MRYSLSLYVVKCVTAVPELCHTLISSTLRTFVTTPTLTLKLEAFAKSLQHHGYSIDIRRLKLTLSDS